LGAIDKTIITGPKKPLWPFSFGHTQGNKHAPSEGAW
jgi:hypothetical protein